MFDSYVLLICYLQIPVCSCRLSRAIHQHTFSHLAGTQFTDCITCLTLQAFLFWFPHTIAFSWVFQCLSLHVFDLVYVFTYSYVFIRLQSFHTNVPPTWLSRAIHQHGFSRLASAQFSDCITCLTSKIFLFLFPTGNCIFACSFMLQFDYTSICFILLPSFLPSVLP